MTDQTIPQPNIPLLRKAVEWAEAEATKPEDERQWHQGLWAAPLDCGTAYCIAGYTVMAAEPQAQVVLSGYGDFDLQIGGERASWGDQAQKLLGLTDDECEDLFEGGNKIADVRRIAEQIAARAGERL